MPLLPDDPTDRAALLTVISGAVLVAWKSLFGAKKDIREDHKHSVINNSYEATIAMLREERDNERARRLEAEAEVAELRRRIAAMEGGE